jgi:TPP-dependent indolepyruvate ferredoxin oxidoreductase alpha subunit
MKTEPILDGIANTAADRCEPLLRAGNTNCGGCGMSVALNMMSRAIAERPVQMVIPACCGIVTAGSFPFSAYGAPIVASTFAGAAAVATGLARVAEANGEKTRVVCFAGDGGTYDIGMATVSGAAERDEDILYICYDTRSTATRAGSARPQHRWVPRPPPHRAESVTRRRTCYLSWRRTEFPTRRLCRWHTPMT